MKRHFASVCYFALSLFFLSACSDQPLNVEQLHCSGALTHSALKNLDFNDLQQAKTWRVECFKFENKLDDSVYYLVDSISGKLISTEVYHFKDGENLSIISCDFSATKRVYLAPNDEAEAFMLTQEYSHAFDSSYIEFTFVNATNSSEVILKLAAEGE